ncbi:MAG: hypothetical protein OXG64_10070 [Chloroflexi bacterium]|nr:hypothetical protein [Chloroflexota bacterium]
MSPIGWIRETLADHQERQEEKRQAREQEKQRKLAIRQRQRQAQQRALRLELQRRDNIIAILDDNKLPQVDWSHHQPLPFKFLKSEHLIYVFPNVGYAEQRIKREIVGRSAGTSVRVARGVSVRVGQSRGTPVERDEIFHRGVGVMAVTTKHLYFAGERTFRIRFSRIVSVQAMRDAVEVTRDRVSGLSEYFILDDADIQFAADLMQSIPALELPRRPETHDPDNYHLLTFDINGDDLA